MIRLGLIGKTLKHSFSKKYFEDKFRADKGLNNQGYQYDLFELENIEEVKALFNIENLIGLNVTIPYKEAVIPYLDELSVEAKDIGAVNTITIHKHKETGAIITNGYNTDYIGFRDSLKTFLQESNEEGHKVPNKALVFGTGGAAKGVCYALKSMGITYQLIGRSTPINYDNLKNKPEVIKESKILINTTPLGTWPNVQECVDIDYSLLTKDHYLYDLVYNPDITAFLNEGICHGAKAKNGHDMLVRQAEVAWEIWHQ